MYTLYMALHITNPIVENAIRQLAGVTGESITEAIGNAARERLERFQPATVQQPDPSFEEIVALIRSYNLQPIHEELTDDEILGYGPDGIPE